MDNELVNKFGTTARFRIETEIGGGSLVLGGVETELGGKMSRFRLASRLRPV